jgi:hypothetical protein
MLKEMKEYIEEFKNNSIEQIIKEIEIVEKRLEKAEKWFEKADIDDPLYSICSEALIDITRKRGALYLRIIEPRQEVLFNG